MCTDKRKQYAFLHLTIFLARIHLDSRYWLSRESYLWFRAGFASLYK